MKKILLSAIFALLVCCSVSAHPIKVTLSNGQVVILESDDYETMADLMAVIGAMERKISSSTDSSNPPTTARKNPWYMYIIMVVTLIVFLSRHYF